MSKHQEIQKIKNMINTVCSRVGLLIGNELQSKRVVRLVMPKLSFIVHGMSYLFKLKPNKVMLYFRLLSYEGICI